MSRPADRDCVRFMVSKTPPGMTPHFGMLAPRWKKARGLVNPPCVVALSLELTWRRWLRKLRMMR